MSEWLLLWANILVISVFQVIAAIGYMRRRQPAKSLGSVACWVVVIALLVYEYRSDLNIPEFIKICMVLTIIGHFFFGTYLDIYHKSIIYDRYLHLFGSFSFALLLFALMDKNAVANGFYRFLFVSMLGFSLGTLFEIAEYAHDVFSKKLPAQHGLSDTDVDMIFNLVGSVIAGIVALYAF